MSPKTETESRMTHWVPEDTLHPAQIAAYQRMTPDQKLKQVDALNRQARKLKAAGFRLQHPDWNEEKIAEEVRLVFLRGVLKN